MKKTIFSLFFRLQKCTKYKLLLIYYLLEMPRISITRTKIANQKQYQIKLINIYLIFFNIYFYLILSIYIFI